MNEPITGIPIQMPWGRTIEFPPHRPLAFGMRLSTHCPVQRVAESYDEMLVPPFDPGVAAMGHLLAHLWCEQTPHPHEAREVSVPWTGGRCHIDRVIPDGDNAGVYEIKTTSDRDPRPKPENIAQVMRYMMACRNSGGDHGDLLSLPWYIVVIGKAGMESGWVRGPWQVTLDDPSPVNVPDVFAGTDEILTGNQYALWDIDATDAMLAVLKEHSRTAPVAEIIADPSLVGAYCACGQHRLPPPVRLDDPELLSVTADYRGALDGENALKGRKSLAYDRVKALLASAEPGRYEVGDMLVVKAKNGRITVK